MIKINFSGKKIFEFKDNNFIQIIGCNEDLKRLIVDVYLKVFNGYRFLDIDMEGMNGYYPEIIKEEKALKKDDIKVIKLSTIEDIVVQLQVKSDSILLKYLLSLSKELPINKALSEIEIGLTELSVELDKLIESTISIGDVSVVTNISDIDFKKITKSFIDIDFMDQYNQIKPLWLLKDIELINLFLNVIRLTIKENNNVTTIIDGLDIRLGLETYNYFIDRLYGLTKEYSNFKIWLIPKTKEGVRIDYEVFEDTYILNDNTVSLGDFDTTYESICRNYPDNNIPTKIQVLNSILKLFPFHYKDKKYYLSKETVILQIFLKLLDESPIRIENTQLSNLETKFLTSTTG